ncbi:glycosyltransferase family 39 protein [Sphingobium sp. Ndbn-10]|uniref:glycosyltransferase family 39 protein n=1 Tax=Sphingobium sp. Ndbn-10 TaxID=1667223 RepID=UPI000818B730|nr:glycosyltransferase family 39 protein [Sphingobium sp. Ndbn-10]
MDIAIENPMPTAPRHSESHGSAFRWVAAALLATLVLQLPLVLNRAINWDEFFHYSQVVKMANGTLTLPLQTLYTRAFIWVPGLPGLGVDHVILIRLFMLACELVTLACIAGIAARFTDRTTGLLCALAYLSASFIFRHGTAFRFDPPATALLMASAWILLRSGLRTPAILSAALLAGISTVLTVKTMLYAPVFAGIAWLLWAEGGRRREDVVRLLALALGTMLCAALLYSLHAGTLGEESGSEARGVIQQAGNRMFRPRDFSHFNFTLVFVLTSPVIAAATLAAPVAIWRGGWDVACKIALTGMWLPIATLLFYQNTYPYYYVFMMAPVAVATAPVFALASRRWGACFIATVMLLCAGVGLALEPENTIERQRQIQREAGQIFPAGVAYFDYCAMLGTFPKANVFMTEWGVEQYLAGDMPNFVEAMKHRPVPLLVNNTPILNTALKSRDQVKFLLPQDLTAIRDTYIPFWGPFWLAGKLIAEGNRSIAWNVRVPGPYTVRDSAMIIDGHRFNKGEVVTLDRGLHILSAEKERARLLWGERLETPVSNPPAEPYYMPF